VTLDPRCQAVRRDLADIRLAEQVFAPHYAAPVSIVLDAPAALREGRDPATPVVASLAAGDRFEVLDILSDVAWGIAPDHRLVGWIARATLGGMPA
jgi:hypothetical protein